jgi:hypothetical protein
LDRCNYDEDENPDPVLVGLTWGARQPSRRAAWPLSHNMQNGYVDGHGDARADKKAVRRRGIKETGDRKY